MNYEQIRLIYRDAPLEIIQRLGHDPVTNSPLVCDGKMGPRTARATYLPVDQLKTRQSRIALDELLRGEGEVGGNNRGPSVNKYFRCKPDSDTKKNRGAWCAAFVTWVLDQAYSFSACWGAIRTVRDHMPALALADIKEGDCVAYRSLTRPAPSGHIGLIVLVLDDCIWSIEGNVDLKPGLSGVAARRLSRQLVRADGNKPHLIGRPFKDQPE